MTDITNPVSPLNPFNPLSPIWIDGKVSTMVAQSNDHSTLLLLGFFLICVLAFCFNLRAEMRDQNERFRKS